ncbi:hypothetical protein CYMTET_45676 [Cymbomonas tetramitiformis]|uniref:Uncharacterized protein n=1 Tax=Cymbomonas tetramitiformis TaxID=36881 RepID=A0AAE0BZI9_9CHLO|nr:hypothetical protein CYMTET_45676 [Cymbomonas tetramitiformis]
MGASSGWPAFLVSTDTDNTQPAAKLEEEAAGDPEEGNESLSSTSSTDADNIQPAAKLEEEAVEDLEGKADLGVDCDPGSEEVRKCKHIGMNGQVRWKARSGGLRTGTLATIGDTEGPLLRVFYAYLGKHLVKVLVDSGASENFISEAAVRRCQLATQASAPMRVTLADDSIKSAGAVAYTRFKAHTRSGKDYIKKQMALRVLPLGIQVDVVLGGKWLRSLSPVTLDYAGHGAISFGPRRKGGGQQRVTLEGCSPGVSMSGKKRQGAGLVDEVFLSTAQLKKHLAHAETRRLAGEGEYLPA